MPNKDKQWEKCLQILQNNLSEEDFNVWIKPISILSVEGNVVTLKVKSRFVYETVEERFRKEYITALVSVFGRNVRVQYSVDVVNNAPDTNVKESSNKNSADISKEKASPNATYRDPFQRQELKAELDSQLNPNYTFENYCCSECNKFAYTVAQTIATNPNGRHFNPLLIFGPTGVGKTHLMQAIGVRIKERNPNMRVLYITERMFETQFVVATKNNNVPDFINFYQSIDVLLMDDVQELGGKQGTQQAFYHIFNHLHQNSRHIIMSSDCPPISLEGIMPRLMGRFKAGVIAELLPPDYNLRRSVLERKAEVEGLTNIPTEVLDYIANNVKDSVRELEGVVVSLLAWAVLLSKDISVEMVQTLVSQTVKVQKHQLSFEEIAQVVSEHFNIDPDLIYSKTRKREIADARQIVMYLAKKHTKLSSTAIGTKLSRDHATVLHAEKTVSQRASVDKQFQSVLAEIESKFRK